ncbi:hypothetical protein Hanom_Chr16g01461251 [Helianthus anomalus]
MQQLVSTSSYTRPSYLRRLRRSLFDSHFFDVFQQRLLKQGFSFSFYILIVW